MSGEVQEMPNVFEIVLRLLHIGVTHDLAEVAARLGSFCNFATHAVNKIFNPFPSFYPFDVSFIPRSVTVHCLFFTHALHGENDLFRCFVLHFKFLPMTFETACILKLFVWSC